MQRNHTDWRGILFGVLAKGTFLRAAMVRWLCCAAAL